MTALGKAMEAEQMAAMPKAENNLPKPTRFKVVVEISRSNLEMYPNTVMARMAAVVWTGDKCHDPNDPFAIDRDCDSFRYVLSNMRNILPMPKPKQSFLPEGNGVLTMASTR